MEGCNGSVLRLNYQTDISGERKILDFNMLYVTAFIVLSLPGNQAWCLPLRNIETSSNCGTLSSL